MSAAFWKGAARGVMDFCGAIAGIGMLLGLLWLLGNPIIRDYVYEKSGTSPAVTTLREDVDAIVADRKELTKKREEQIKDLDDAISNLKSAVNTMGNQVQNLTNSTNQLSRRIDAVLQSLSQRASAPKLQDRLIEEGDGQ